MSSVAQLLFDALRGATACDAAGSHYAATLLRLDARATAQYLIGVGC